MNQTGCPTCNVLNRAGARFCCGCGAALPYSQTSSVSTGGSLPGQGTGRLPPQCLIKQRYLIIKKVGQGGMGAVYQAVDTKDGNNTYAVKEMSNSAISDLSDRQYAVAQFRQEADILRRISHPNLPYVTDSFEIGDRHYLIMEFVVGNTLQQRMDRGEGPFSESQTLYWGEQLCDVLDCLHSQSPPVIFRDIKPDNIMITTSSQVKLIDFGIARLFKPGKTRDTMSLGTEGFAAPEQYGSGQTDARSDVYSLGATLFYLLTGAMPQLGSPIPPVRRLNPAVSGPTEQLILRATQQNCSLRFPDVVSLKRAMPTTGQSASAGVQVRNSQTVGASTTSQAVSPPKTSRITTRLLIKTIQLDPIQLAAAAGTLLILILLGAWFLTPVIQGTWFWYNIPLISVVAPFAFVATRKEGAAAVAQIVVALIGGAIVWFRLGYQGDLLGLFAGALASAVAIEVMTMLLPRVMGNLKPEDPGAWQREAIWMGLAAVLGNLLLSGIAFGFPFSTNLIAWISAFFLGVLGWFLGDLLHGYLLLKQTGMNWR